MPSDSTENRPPATAKNHHVAPQQPEHVPCPRCDSTNTKFCYYNNYNFSQPRHFCKSCRRYWTHGGTLRDIPVGGSTRKNAKRSRRVSTATSRNESTVSSGLDHHRHFSSVANTPLLLPFAGDDGGGPRCGSFTSLLSNSQNPGVYGLGFDQDLSFGLGKTMWPFSAIGDGVVAGHAAAGGCGGVNTWQLVSGEGGGDCFVLPDLAVSRRGNAMKLE